ncbi:MAG: DUF4097 domain-containing protein [Phycisphaerales bacterium]
MLTLAKAAPAAVALLTLTACGSHYNVFNTPTHHEDRAMSVAHVSGSALSVVTANGSVTAKADNEIIDNQVHIEARLYSKDLERLAFAQVQAERAGDGSLRVWVEWPAPGRQKGEGAKVRINLPDANGVSIRSSNGSIHAEGLAGHANLTSSNGSIVIRHHDGDLIADTSNGSIRAEHVAGPIDIDTSNGSVVVEEAIGPVLVETSNGSVAVQTNEHNPGPVRVRTSNGRVQLDLGHGFSGVLKLNTSNAKIRAGNFENARLIESSKNHVELQFGDDETISAVRTSNGSISVSGSD